MFGASGKGARSPEGAADDFLHACARDERPSPRYRAWRRGHRPVVHLRLHRQRVRPARRAAGLRRRPARHAEPRRARSSSADHRRGRGPSSPSTTPASAARWTPSWPIAAAPRHRRRRGQRARLFGTYRGQPLGTFGLPGDSELSRNQELQLRRRRRAAHQRRSSFERAEIIREKGTNRSRFFRGQVDKYTWVDIGSSYLPSDLSRPSCRAVRGAGRDPGAPPGHLEAVPPRARRLGLGERSSDPNDPAGPRTGLSHVLPADAVTGGAGPG